MPSSPDFNRPIPPAAAREVHRGNMIEAIKIVREATGLGLKDAKDWVERYRDNPITLSPDTIPMEELESGFGAPADTLPAAAIAALKQGRIIEAVREVRQATGLGLKEAKDRVDQYLAQHANVASATEKPAPHVAQEPRSFGWLAFLLIAAALAWFWWRH